MKYLGRHEKGSVDDLAAFYEPEEVDEALQKKFPGMTADEIVREVRR
jgi:hypothetical protein